MAYNIRPLSFSEVLDWSFQVLRDNFALLAGISLVVWIPYGVLLEFDTRHTLAGAIVTGIYGLIMLPLGTAAANFAVADLFLGKSTTIQESYKSMLSIFAPLFGTYFITGIFVVLGLIALVIPGVYLGICWSLILTVMVIERRFGMTAMSRSRALVRGAWWRTFGIMFVAGFLAQLPAYGLMLVWAYLPVLGPILNAITQGIFATFPVVVGVIYYFDRRCRLEDFDLRLLAEQIRAEPASPPAALSRA